MSLEDLTGSNKYIGNLVPSNPPVTDPAEQGANHIQGIKNVLINTFGPVSSPVLLPSNLSLRNYLINGCFRVWQRGASGSAPTGQYTYTADRWTIDAAGAALAWGQGGAPVSGYIPGCISIVGAAGNTSSNLTQRIESIDSNRLSNKKITVSYSVYGNATSGATVQAVLSAPDVKDTYPAVTAIQAAPSVPIVNGAFTRYTFTFNAPGAAAGRGLMIAFGVSWLTAGQNVAFGNIQLEEGDIASSFEVRPYGMELDLCKRYYQTIGGPLYFSMTGLSSPTLPYCHFQHLWSPSLRAAPVLTPGASSNLTGMSNTINSAGIVRYVAQASDPSAGANIADLKANAEL